MKKRPSPKKQICIYCGEREASTHDHVPPACLFPSPRPANLVTVPSCGGCNSGASKDDEYFRMVLVIRNDAAHNDDAQRLVDAVHRSLAKPKKRGMLEALFKSMRQIRVRTPAGLHLGKAWTYNVDLTRLGRVTNRIVRGLYYQEFGLPIPVQYEVKSFAVSGLVDLDAATRAAVDQTVNRLTRKPGKAIGAAVIEYWHESTEKDPFTSAWLLRFFRGEWFLCITAPKQSALGSADRM